MSSDVDKFIDTEVADALIDLGQDEEELLKDFELIDEREVDYDLEDELDTKISELNKVELANTGSAKPYSESEQDGKSKQEGEEDIIFLTRYMYEPKKTQSNSREFCKKMISAKKVYRKEDIMAMEDKVVNAGFGKGGSDKYSVWLYKGGLQYADLEEEISNFHINNIQAGLSPSMLINFNSGTPSAEERERIERRIYDKFSGSSNAGKFILSFNDNAETAATVEPIQLSDAHQQYHLCILLRFFIRICSI